jgi:pyridoxine kinase
MDRAPVDVVVISSQVVYGSVGAGVTCRVLSDAGYRCVMVPTVLLSNLPHYETVHGGAIGADWFSGILDDLLVREVLGQTRYVVVGYLASAEQATLIKTWFHAVKRINPGVQLVLDPAMGDDDEGLYTAPEVANGHRDQLLAEATGLTPNRYELEILTGESAPDLESAARLGAGLLSDTTRWAIITSAKDQVSESPRINNMIVTENGATTHSYPMLTNTAKGAGDYFCATLVRQLLRGDSLETAEKVAAHAVIDLIR